MTLNYQGNSSRPSTTTNILKRRVQMNQLQYAFINSGLKEATRIYKINKDIRRIQHADVAYTIKITREEELRKQLQDLWK